MQSSRLLGALSRDGNVRLILADSTGIVLRAQEIHHPSRTASAALGRSLTAASIMGSLLKAEQGSITLQINGDGPLGQIVCISDSRGYVRGYVENPEVQLPPNAQGKLDVGGAVGQGHLYVIRDLGMSQPYIGYSPLVSGEIAEDITHYFALSEQTPSVCSLGVCLNPDHSCCAAGGFLLQLLPGADESVIQQLEQNIDSLDSITTMMTDGLSAEMIIARVLSGIEFDILNQTEIEYHCNCSSERYARALISLGAEELEDLKKEGQPVETCCHFCSACYIFDPDALDELLAQAKS